MDLGALLSIAARDIFSGLSFITPPIVWPLHSNCHKTALRLLEPALLVHLESKEPGTHISPGKLLTNDDEWGVGNCHYSGTLVRVGAMLRCKLPSGEHHHWILSSPGIWPDIYPSLPVSVLHISPTSFSWNSPNKSLSPNPRLRDGSQANSEERGQGHFQSALVKGRRRSRTILIKQWKGRRRFLKTMSTSNNRDLAGNQWGYANNVQLGGISESEHTGKRW